MEIHQDIASLLGPFEGELLTRVHGPVQPELRVQALAAPQQGGPGDLVFVWQKQARDALRERVGNSATGPSVIVINEDLYEDGLFASADAVYTTKKAEWAMAVICEGLFALGQRNKGYRIHPRAVVAASAKVPESVVIGPHCVVEDDVVLGEGVVIGPAVTIERGSHIGAQSLIEAGVFIGENTRIGKRVHIQPGAVIGSDGFGFASDGKRFLRLPHLGNVEIGDDVTIGANNCIDRGKFDATRIGRGTKLDNFCHIAHNVQLGADGAIAAAFCAAGSAVIGDRFMASGQCGVHPHIHITDDVSLAFRAGVTQHIKEKGAYGGLPSSPMQRHLRYSMALKTLPELKKQVHRLEQQLADWQKEGSSDKQ